MTAPAGGSRPFLPNSFIWSKWGPLPAWAWMLIALGAAILYSQWQKNRVTVDPTTTADTLPPNTAAPVVWKTDIFNQFPVSTPVTVTVPTAPPGGGRPAPPADSVGTRAGGPLYTEVKPGWHVDQWINDYRGMAGGNPALSWPLLEQLNPNIASNVTWHKSSAQNTFKTKATYRTR